METPAQCILGTSGIRPGFLLPFTRLKAAHAVAARPPEVSVTMPKQVPALTVSQWLPTWDRADFSPDQFRRQPPKQFLLFSMDAAELRQLIGIQRRSLSGVRPRAQDLGIQRIHDSARSEEIADYVEYGFPWSSLSTRQRKNPDNADLIKPGWLPTAVVVNILLPEDVRESQSVDANDIVSVQLQNSTAIVEIPDTTQDGWKLSGLPPIEVIDGQHRLWAFDREVEGYQVPVVAFHGLDRSWQAYLFYTINISPKRINLSLAYDLYPLLRIENWLEKFEGHSVYRESRAQELTEALWSYEASAWYQRINMLGERGMGMVSQASWVRSLLATFVKSWEGRGVKIGGLFGAPVGENSLVLPWSRAQQAAFLIDAWTRLAIAIDEIAPEWTRELDYGESESLSTVAMESTDSMLNSDMGVRAFLYILNDLCFVRATDLELSNWQQEFGSAATSDVAVSSALASLSAQPVAEFVTQTTKALAKYDWRSSKASNLTTDERQAKARFRGSGGYRELRQELLQHLAQFEDSAGRAAREVLERLGL